MRTLTKLRKRGSSLIIILSSAAVIAFIAGLLVVGGLQSARAKKNDDAALIAISETARYLTCHYSTYETFPDSLETLSDWVANPPPSARDRGPSYACDSVYPGNEWRETDQVEYRVVGVDGFELCAEFTLPSDGSRLRPYQRNHTSLTDLDKRREEAGHQCYRGTLAAIIATERPVCESIAACVLLLKTYKIDTSSSSKSEHLSSFTIGPLDVAVDFLRRQGDEALSALVPLLEDPNHDIHNRAAYVIGRTNKVDGKHLENLIAAHQDGIGWLEASIGSTRRQEALDYLWQDFLEYSDRHQKSNTRAGLANFREQVHPYIEIEIAKCLAQPTEKICFGLVELSESVYPFPETALPLFELLLTTASLAEHQIWKTESQISVLKERLAE